MTLEELKKRIIHANEAYRKGSALISDSEFDALVEELKRRTGGRDPLFSSIGFEVNDRDIRKEDLPVPMFSMNKIKSSEELRKWAKNKGIGEDTLVVITPKFDGLSFLVQENQKKAWTRGNGFQGQKSDAHFAVLMSNKEPVKIKINGYTSGEVIMRKEVFRKNWSGEFKNSRNMGAGALNTKEPKKILSDFDFIRFGLHLDEDGFKDREEEIIFLNKNVNTVKLEYFTCLIKDLTDSLLNKYYSLLNKEYEIDGLIIEINDKKLRSSLGRERNGNPVYARAWKGFREEEKITKIREIVYQISKYGLLKPVARVEPVELDGAVVSNVTLINARYMRENGIGVGSLISIIRSGQVIPKVVRVIERTGDNLPLKCPSCGALLQWNESNVELKCSDSRNCIEQKIQKVIAFFEIMEVDNLSDGIVRQLFNSGHDSIKKILELSIEDFERLENFKERKAGVIYNSIHSRMKNARLEKIMHASSLFEGLGSKKLILLSRYNSPEIKPDREEILGIEGFSDKSADIFIEGYKAFWAFIAELPITIAREEVSLKSEKLKDFRVCFSGVRSKELEKTITDNGGKIVNGVSGKTTYLVVKEKGSGSSKEKKALDNNIQIATIGEFENLARGIID